MLFLVQIDLTGADLAAFERHEAMVLPLLADHGARIERRLRGPDDDFETHILRFPSQGAMDAYLADPRRAAAAELWLRSGATAERWEVSDLPLCGGVGLIAVKIAGSESLTPASGGLQPRHARGATALKGSSPWAR